MGELARRAATTARNLVLVSRTAVRHLEDDPVLLAVQTVRRLPAGGRRRLARALVYVASVRRPSSGSGGHGTLAAAFAEYLADHPASARTILRDARPASRAGRRLRDELAVSVGDAAPDDAAPAVRARSAWHRGHLTEAITALSPAPGRAAARQRTRLESERQLLSPGSLLTPPVVRQRPAADGIRALHVLTNSLPWTQSGYSLRSHAILRAQAAAGVAVEAVTRIGYPVVVGLPHAGDRDVVDGITYRRVLSTRLADTPEARLQQMVEALAPVVEDFRPGVLHTTTHFPNALVTQALAEGAGVPWVYEVRGQLEKTWLASRPEDAREEAAGSERYQLARARETEMAQAADHVITLSEALRADLVDRGVAAERISVVPNAVPSSLLDPAGSVSSAAARAQLGLPVSGFWVGTVTSLVDYEGIDVLVDAVALLRSGGHDIRCAIVGDGVSRPGLVAQVARLGLQDAVTLPGRVPRQEAAAWHRALDVFVVPRRDVEVCRTVTPLKPIEAMAAGRPVVASDLPALAEVVTAPQTGLVSVPGDVASLAHTLLRLSADPGLAEQLGANGRRFASTRTWEFQAETYREIYQGLRDAR